MIGPDYFHVYTCLHTLLMCVTLSYRRAGQAARKRPKAIIQTPIKSTPASHAGICPRVTT